MSFVHGMESIELCLREQVRFALLRFSLVLGVVFLVQSGLDAFREQRRHDCTRLRCLVHHNLLPAFHHAIVNDEDGGSEDEDDQNRARKEDGIVGVKLVLHVRRRIHPDLVIGECSIELDGCVRSGGGGLCGVDVIGNVRLKDHAIVLGFVGVPLPDVNHIILCQLEGERLVQRVFDDACDALDFVGQGGAEVQSPVDDRRDDADHLPIFAKVVKDGIMERADGIPAVLLLVVTELPNAQEHFDRFRRAFVEIGLLVGILQFAGFFDDSMLRCQQGFQRTSQVAVGQQVDFEDCRRGQHRGHLPNWQIRASPLRFHHNF
mmetsp:Transcript_16982/g.47661  ORF Transcript_16982/g.47661 Transcript_16982/m.47661 type:complete len:319 (+) Transcript_16982:478-1434(+)